MARRTPTGSVGSSSPDADAVSVCGITDWLSPAPLRRRAHARETALEIGKQVIHVLKADVNAHGRAGRIPAGARPQSGWIGGHHEAFVSAPAVAQLEKIHVIKEGGERCIGAALQGEPEQPRGAKEIALPDGMTGVVGQSRVMHPINLRSFL